jgi:hypothetical protein
MASTDKLISLSLHELDEMLALLTEITAHIVALKQQQQQQSVLPPPPLIEDEPDDRL